MTDPSGLVVVYCMTLAGRSSHLWVRLRLDYIVNTARNTMINSPTNRFTNEMWRWSRQDNDVRYSRCSDLLPPTKNTENMQILR